jgi:hypothetical protein
MFMLYRVAQRGRDLIDKAEPADIARLSATSVACGATQAIPMPFTGAPMIEATWVPCPYRSCTAALFAQ